MNKSEYKRAIVVGVFVLIGILILVAGIFTLGGQQNRFSKNITISAIFSDVEGLRKGNNIWFSGVKVGTVKEIKFHGDSELEVFMNIRENVQEYIRKDAKVKITSESLIGNRIVTIYGGSTGVPYAEDGDLLSTEMPPSTDDMMATLQQNNENLVSITRDFKSIAASMAQGQGTVGALLKDTTMADNFRNIVEDLQEVSNNTASASQAINQFAAKLNTPGGLANELMTDTTVFQALQNSVQQLEQAANSTQTLTNNLNQASRQLQSTESGIGVLLNDEEFGTRLKHTMQNMETSSEKLDENLEALQHNFLFRRYFRRKARAEAQELD